MTEVAPRRVPLLALLGVALVLSTLFACRRVPQVEPTSVPLTVAVATATVATGATPTAVTTIAPAKATTVVPILYDFFDWGTDFRAQHPEWGPVGSIQFTTWTDLNPAPGVYNWDAIDRNLAKEKGLTVQLLSGQIVSKPVQIQVLAHMSTYSGWSGLFYDATPGWVYDKIEAEGGGARPQVNGRKIGYAIQPQGCSQPAAVPMYDNPTWRQAYWDMVRALGARYDGNPQVTSVIITTGIDGETVPCKDVSGCKANTALNEKMPDLIWAFQDFALTTMRVYRQSFPTKPIFINNAPAGAGFRRETSELAAALNPPVGLKNSGLLPDVQNHYGIGDEFGGMWDPERVYSGTLPIWIESNSGLGNRTDYYWSLLAALHYHPAAIDLHAPYFEQTDAAVLQFVQRHLGVTLQDTPDVWTVLRDREYQPISWGKNGQTGKPGDWQFWLYRLDLPEHKTVVVKRTELPAAARDAIESRQARRTDQASNNKLMSFNVDDRVWFAGTQAHQLRVELTFLNRGTDTLSIEYMDGSGKMARQTIQKGAALGPADQWVTQTLTLENAVLANGLPDGADLRLSCEGDGDEIVHRLVVAPVGKP